MFDLFRRRDKAMRYLLTVLLGLVALSMVITLIPGYGTPRAASENVVAEVGGEAITSTEVQSLLQNALRNRQVPPEMMQFYVPQFIDQRIAEKAMAYEAKRLGFQVSDEELATAIRSLLVSVMPPGQFNREVYQRVLAEQNMTVEQFERNVRENLLVVKFQNLALEGVVVPPGEIAQEYHRRNDKVKLEYVAFQPNKTKIEVSVTPEEARAFYNQNKTAYKTPERRSFGVLIADENKTGETISVSDDQLRRAYNANIERFRTPERVKVRHILIKTMDKPSSEVPKLEAKANDLLKQLKGGADFAELAKKNSEDTGSAIKGGDLDWVTRGQTVKAFEQAAFSLQPKQLSDVIRTEYGFHILQVMDKEQARTKPFDEVKGELTTEVKRSAVYDRMQNAIEQARAELVKAPQNAQAIASKYNLIYAKADRVAAGESVPEVGTNRELEASLMSARPNEVTPVIQLGPNRLGVAVLYGVDASKPAEFAEVESQIQQQLRQNKTAQLIQQKREEAGQRMKNANGDLKAVAQALGTEIKTSDLITSEGNIPDIGPATVLADSFAKPSGSVLGPITIGDTVVMARILEKQPADETKLSATEREQILSGLKRRKALERRELFEDGVVARLTKDGKIKKYPEAIRRLGTTYRG